jgi:signal transduction histidine kinase
MQNAETSRFPFCPQPASLRAQVRMKKGRFPFYPERRCLLAHFFILPSAFFIIKKLARKVLNRTRCHQSDSHGPISSSLAHELNNLLTVVKGQADRLFVKHKDDAVLAPNLKKISESAHRAAELVRNAPRLELNPPTA